MGAWLLAATQAMCAGWTPVVDAVYLQEVGQQSTSEAAINTVAILGNDVFCGTDKGLFQLKGDALAAVEGALALAGPIEKLDTLGGALYAYTPKGFHVLRDNAWKLVLAYPGTGQNLGQAPRALRRGCLACRAGVGPMKGFASLRGTLRPCGGQYRCRIRVAVPRWCRRRGSTQDPQPRSIA